MNTKLNYSIGQTVYAYHVELGTVKATIIELAQEKTDGERVFELEDEHGNTFHASEFDIDLCWQKGDSALLPMVCYYKDGRKTLVNYSVEVTKIEGDQVSVKFTNAPNMEPRTMNVNQLIQNK